MAEEKKGKKVEKTFIRRFTESMFLGSREQVEAITFATIVEKLKDLVFTVISQGLHVWFYEDAGSPIAKIGSKVIDGSKVINYDKMSQPLSKRSSFVVAETEFPSINDAISVIDQCRKDIAKFKYCSVGMYYDHAGVDTTSTDFEWGWTGSDIDGDRVSIRKTTKGTCIVIMPKPKQLPSSTRVDEKP